MQPPEYKEVTELKLGPTSVAEDAFGDDVKVIHIAHMCGYDQCLAPDRNHSGAPLVLLSGSKQIRTFHYACADRMLAEWHQERSELFVLPDHFTEEERTAVLAYRPFNMLCREFHAGMRPGSLRVLPGASPLLRTCPPAVVTLTSPSGLRIGADLRDLPYDTFFTFMAYNTFPSEAARPRVSRPSLPTLNKGKFGFRVTTYEWQDARGMTHILAVARPDASDVTSLNAFLHEKFQTTSIMNLGADLHIDERVCDEVGVHAKLRAACLARVGICDEDGRQGWFQSSLTGNPSEAQLFLRCAPWIVNDIPDVPRFDMASATIQTFVLKEPHDVIPVLPHDDELAGLVRGGLWERDQDRTFSATHGGLKMSTR